MNKIISKIAHTAVIFIEGTGSKLKRLILKINYLFRKKPVVRIHAVNKHKIPPAKGHDTESKEAVSAMKRQENSRQLLKAIYSKRLEVVLSHLTNEFNPDFKDKSGKTLLLAAIENFNLEAVNQLLRLGCNPNTADTEGWYPLNYALVKLCENSEIIINIIGSLLKSGANPNQKNLVGMLPIESVLILDRKYSSQIKKLLDLLLLYHVDVDGCNRGISAAMLAKECYLFEAFNKISKIEKSLLAKQLDAHKLMCVLFGINITISEQKNKISLRGFHEVHTFELLQEAVENKIWEKEAPKDWTDADSQAILNAVHQVLTYKNIDRIEENNLEEWIKALQQSAMQEEIAIIPTGPYQHSNVVVLCGDYLIKGDKATLNPGYVLYRINDKTRLSEVIQSLIESKNGSVANKYIQSEINDILKLKRLYEGNLHPQKGPSCTWSSSAKLSFRMSIFLRLVGKGYDFEKAFEISQKMDKEWAHQIRLKALNQYLLTPDNDHKKYILACIHCELEERVEAKTSRRKTPQSQKRVGYYREYMKAISTHCNDAVVLSQKFEKNLLLQDGKRHYDQMDLLVNPARV